MEQLKWKNRNQTYQYAYNQREIQYTCPKCEHKFDDVVTVPFKCPTCKMDLNNVGSLIVATNQDMRVKFFVNGSL